MKDGKQLNQESFALAEKVEVIQDEAEKNIGSISVQCSNSLTLSPNGIQLEGKKSVMGIRQLFGSLFLLSYSKHAFHPRREMWRDAGIAALVETFRPLSFQMIAGYKPSFGCHLLHQNLANPLNVVDVDQYGIIKGKIYVEQLFCTMEAVLKSEVFQNNTNTVKSHIIRHYWLSAAFCYGGDNYVSDFITIETDKIFVLLGEDRLSLNFQKKIYSLFSVSAGVFPRVDEINAYGIAVPYHGCQAVLLVDAISGVIDSTRNQIIAAQAHKIVIKAVFLDECGEAKDQEALDLLQQSIEGALFSAHYKDIPVIRCYSRVATESKDKESKDKDSAVIQSLQSLLDICEIKAQDTGYDYFGPKIPGAPVMKHIARLERSAIAAGMRTPWAEVVQNELLAILCCTQHIGDNDIKDLIQCWYLSYVVKSPFYYNGAEYPPLITLEGGVVASRVITQEWGQALWSSAKSG